MTKFGLLQVVRQRLGSSALSLTTEPCPCCGGSGIRRNLEWQALAAIKEIYRLLLQSKGQESLTYEAPPELAIYLLNQKREKLLEMEQTYSVPILIKSAVNGHQC